MFTLTFGRCFAPRRAAFLCAAVLVTWSAGPRTTLAQSAPPQPIVHKIQAASERMEMVVNSSRILTLGAKIPQAQVNNPEILEVTPLSATQVQIFAKKPGVTQVNLWNEKNEVHTLDVIVFGDARELQMILESQFPKSSLKVTPLSNSVVISGYVDDPYQVSRIVAIAEDYHPKVINNITVGGVQQVLLRVKVMEVSRTKMRRMGFDFTNFSGNGDFFASTVSGLVSSVTNTTSTVQGSGAIQFGLVGNNNAFFGFLDALHQRDLLKILAEPNLVTVSGRPASFLSGGEVPILIPQSLGTVSVQFRDFGTKVDFVPIVLGNGAIRLEVRPEVSEPDPSLGVTIGGQSTPGFRTRRADTGVEMRPGQTLAIAGLLFQRTETQVKGVPWVSDLPWVGAAFRRVQDEVNEIELLIVVTPELVEAMDPDQVPPCGPGASSTTPNDWQLYWRGHVEVPSCGPCGVPGAQGGGPGEIPPGQEQLQPQGENVAPPSGPGAHQEVRVTDGPAGGPRRLPATNVSSSDPRRAPAVRPASAPWKLERASQRGPAATKPNSPTNRSNPPKTAQADAAPGFIGPLGYDVVK